MNNYIAQLVVLVFVLVIAGLKSLRVEASDLPESTGQKQLQALLKLQQVLQSNLLLLNILLLLLLALASYDIFQIIALAFAWLVAVHLLSAVASVGKHARRIALRNLPLLLKVAAALQPALNLLDNTRFIITRKADSFNSKEELLQAIQKSRGVLSEDERRAMREILA